MIIYKITNKVNGMVYIGQTKRSLQARWRQHKYNLDDKYSYSRLKAAIKEHGAENFTVEQIDCADTKAEADAKEKYWISFYRSTEYGYNHAPGGQAGGGRKKVKCVEDDLVFNSRSEAAKHYGVTIEAIRQAIDKPHLKSAGKHWISV